MSNDFRVVVTGMDELIRMLARGGAEVPTALSAALLEEASIIFRMSQVQVPFKRGTLKNSGQVVGPVVAGGAVEVAVGYGGAASAYAYIIHRGITPKTGKALNMRNGKKARYLSDPLRDRLPGMGERISARVQMILEAGRA